MEILLTAIVMLAMMGFAFLIGCMLQEYAGLFKFDKKTEEEPENCITVKLTRSDIERLYCMYKAGESEVTFEVEKEEE